MEAPKDDRSRTMAPRPVGRVISVNSGQATTVRWHDRDVTSGIWKRPVVGRRRVEGVNLAGDEQHDRRVHGGPTKSLYAYAAEDYGWWAEELGHPLEPGTFGENLTTEGVDLAAAVVGERWRLGTALLRVTEPRIPCFKLGMRMGDAAFVDRFADAARPGTYLAIDVAGDVGADDTIELVERPDHGLTVGAVERAYHADPALLPTLVDCPELSDAWRAWARRSLSRTRPT
jgi:MOSC domain-containing protein YiiM